MSGQLSGRVPTSATEALYSWELESRRLMRANLEAMRTPPKTEGELAAEKYLELKARAATREEIAARHRLKWNAIRGGALMILAWALVAWGTR